MTMLKLVGVLGVAYGAMGAAIFAFHVTHLQIVTPGLALARAALWPLWLATGHPHGSPLTRD